MTRPICIPENVGKTLVDGLGQLFVLDELGVVAGCAVALLAPVWRGGEPAGPRRVVAVGEAEQALRLHRLASPEAPRVCVPENIGKTFISPEGHHWVYRGPSGTGDGREVFADEIGRMSFRPDIVERGFRLADEHAPDFFVDFNAPNSAPISADGYSAAFPLAMYGTVTTDEAGNVVDPVTAAYAALPPFEFCSYLGVDCGLPAGHRDVPGYGVCISRSLTSAEEARKLLDECAKNASALTPPPKPHRFDDPYLSERFLDDPRKTFLRCSDCGEAQPNVEPGEACEPDPHWREDRDVEAARLMAAHERRMENYRTFFGPGRPPRPEPHSPSISGLGAIACRMQGRRR